jgi:hypothetical protein
VKIGCVMLKQRFASKMDKRHWSHQWTAVEAAAMVEMDRRRPRTSHETTSVIGSMMRRPRPSVGQM